MTTTVTITFPGPAPAGLADELATDLGVHPHVESHPRGIDLPAASVVISAALGMLVSGMLEHFGAEAANRLMRGLGRLRRAAPAACRDVRLVDEANNIVIVIDQAALSDDRAMKALVAQERDVFLPDVELRWNPATARWQARRS